MNRWQLILVTAALAWGVVPASAQFPDYNRPYSYMRPPVLSPYLNLALGRDPAVNYFLGVRNDMDRRANERILGNAILDVERRTGQSGGTIDPFPILTGTGHPSAFMNYGSYYNFGRQGGAPARRGR